MDGREPLLHTPDRAGILYAEDFDGPAPPPVPDPAPEPEPVEATFSSGEMEMARQLAAEAAVARAHAEWEGSDAHARTLALCAIAAELTAAQDAGRALAEAAADGTVRTVLTMVAGMLPAFCAGHGEAEVQRLLAHLLPVLHREAHITVRVSPAIADAVRASLQSLDDDLAAHVTVTAAPMPPGDARVAWADGFLVRDGAAIHAAMTAALAELGLHDPGLARHDPQALHHEKGAAAAGPGSADPGWARQAPSAAHTRHRDEQGGAAIPEPHGQALPPAHHATASP